MSVHVLTELRKRDKMRDLSSMLSLFCKTFSKFNKHYIYHMELKLIKSVLSRVCYLLCNLIMDVIT